MNPYTGTLIKKMKTVGNGEFDFFRFIIDGHRSLWLPDHIGRPIVGVGTLIFLVLLISGLVMWWPRKWSNSRYKKRFRIKWDGSFKRINYDLHNVLGFYTLVLALGLGITGLVWSFTWFEDGLYYLASGGEEHPGHHHPHSDPSQAGFLQKDEMSVLDRAWYKVLAQEQEAVARLKGGAEADGIGENIRAVRVGEASVVEIRAEEGAVARARDAQFEAVARRGPFFQPAHGAVEELVAAARDEFPRRGLVRARGAAGRDQQLQAQK